MLCAEVALFKKLGSSLLLALDVLGVFGFVWALDLLGPSDRAEESLKARLTIGAKTWCRFHDGEVVISFICDYLVSAGNLT